MQIYSAVAEETFEEIVNDNDNDWRQVITIAHMVPRLAKKGNNSNTA